MPFPAFTEEHALFRESVRALTEREIAASVIHACGSEELKREWLAPAIRGEHIAALGITEPGAGSNVAGLRTTARRDGDDYVIDGSQIFITNGAVADFVALAVRTGGPGPRGIRALIVPTDASGFTVGRKLRKLMAHASDTAELFFESCRVPAGSLVGEKGQGFRDIMRSFQGERLVLSYITNSFMREILEETLW